MTETTEEPDLDTAPPEDQPRIREQEERPRIDQHPRQLTPLHFQEASKAGEMFANTIREFQAASPTRKPGTAEPPKEPAPKEAPKPNSDPAPYPPVQPPPTTPPRQEPPPPIVPPGIKGEAAENFRKIVARAEAAEKKAVELEGKVKGLEASGDKVALAEAQKKLEETTKKATEYEGIVQQFYVEHDPTFQRVFGGKISSAIEDAKASAGAAGEAVAEICTGAPGKVRDRAMKEAITNLDEFDRGMVIQAYDRLRQAEKERASELGKARENFKALQARDAKQRGEKELAGKQAGELLQKQALEAADALEKLGDWDTDGEAAAFRREWVTKAIREELPPTEAVKLPAQAAEYFRMKDRVIPTLLAKIADQDKQLAAYQAAAPNGGTGRTNAPGQRSPGRRTDNWLSMPQQMPAKEKFLEALGQGGA